MQTLEDVGASELHAPRAGGKPSSSRAQHQLGGARSAHRRRAGSSSLQSLFDLQVETLLPQRSFLGPARSPGALRFGESQGHNMLETYGPLRLPEDQALRGSATSSRSAAASAVSKVCRSHGRKSSLSDSLKNHSTIVEASDLVFCKMSLTSKPKNVAKRRKLLRQAHFLSTMFSIMFHRAQQTCACSGEPHKTAEPGLP